MKVKIGDRFYGKIWKSSWGENVIIEVIKVYQENYADIKFVLAPSQEHLFRLGFIQREYSINELTWAKLRNQSAPMGVLA